MDFPPDFCSKFKMSLIMNTEMNTPIEKVQERIDNKKEAVFVYQDDDGSDLVFFTKGKLPKHQQSQHINFGKQHNRKNILREKLKQKLAERK